MSRVGPAEWLALPAAWCAEVGAIQRAWRQGEAAAHAEASGPTGERQPIGRMDA